VPQGIDILRLGPVSAAFAPGGFFLALQRRVPEKKKQCMRHLVQQHTQQHKKNRVWTDVPPCRGVAGLTAGSHSP
jgi:hypothetical protein